MQQHRRTFLRGATARATAAFLCGSQTGFGQTEKAPYGAAQKSTGLEKEIVELSSDLPTVERKIRKHELPLNESVWSPGSPIFNPPDLSGLVSEQTAMEAMVIHSDNSATDMVLKETRAGAVRSFATSISPWC